MPHPPRPKSPHMPLLTKILKPHQFNAETIAGLFPPEVHSVLEETAQYVLNSLESRGIVSKTEILKPAEFNSTTIAILMWERSYGPNGWDQTTEMARQDTIDQAQWILDALYQDGIVA